jgi:protein-S-isoprenylcysteine O-methyltransferase
MANLPNGTPRPEITRPTASSTGMDNPTHKLDAKLRQSQRAREAESQDLRFIPRAFWPGGQRSLSGIAIRAFFLGNGAVLGLLLSLALGYSDSRFWRPFFFIGTLCIFHFLEFYTTAEYNTPSARVESFLLTNGSQYRMAHTIALVETTITSAVPFLSAWQARINPAPIITLGIIMIVVGQVVRSMAMAQAGTNFNHQVQSHKNDGHELVTSGLYAYFRHPSYFGFFWWGLGTQVALGNTVSLFGYAGVLWYFFNHRIRGMYVKSKARTFANNICQVRRSISSRIYLAMTTKRIRRALGPGYPLSDDIWC